MRPVFRCHHARAFGSAGAQRAAAVVTTTSVIAFTTGAVFTQSRPSGAAADLRVSFIDVGQGDAIWIQTPGPDSRNILIDGGPDSGPENRLLVYLKRYGLPPGRTIDCIVATHPHDDHYKGLLDVLAKYQVRTIIDAGFPKTGSTFAAFVQASEAELVNGRPAEFLRARAQRDINLDWGPGIVARIIYADSASVSGMGRDNTRENNASTVIRMTFGRFSFLFMGDAEGKERTQPASTVKFVEHVLLKTLPPDALRSTVLKAGHHGSETGSTLPFLNVVRPDVVVVMSGRRKFGTRFIPDLPVLQRYRTASPDVILARTDDQDAAEGRTTKDDADGDDVYIRANQSSLRVYQAIGEDRRRVWVKLGEVR